MRCPPSTAAARSSFAVERRARPGSRLLAIPYGGIVCAMPGYEMSKDQLLARLRRVEGQVRGLQQMIEADRYCVDVLTQISAVNKALQTVAVGMLDDHLRHCVADAVSAGGSEADRKLAEATEAIGRLLKS